MRFSLIVYDARPNRKGSEAFRKATAAARRELEIAISALIKTQASPTRVWLKADVHLRRRALIQPDRRVSGFEPFWEFVSGRCMRGRSDRRLRTILGPEGNHQGTQPSQAELPPSARNAVLRHVR